jgi:hypothetical protein
VGGCDGERDFCAGSRREVRKRRRGQESIRERRWKEGLGEEKGDAAC